MIKNVWGKRKDKAFRREGLIDRYFTCEINSYMLIMFLKNMSHQKIYTSWYCVVNHEVPLISSQIVKQIKVIQEEFLAKVSKLSGSAPDKKQRDQTQFYPNSL